MQSIRRRDRLTLRRSRSASRRWLLTLGLREAPGRRRKSATPSQRLARPHHEAGDRLVRRGGQPPKRERRGDGVRYSASARKRQPIPEAPPPEQLRRSMYALGPRPSRRRGSRGSAISRCHPVTSGGPARKNVSDRARARRVAQREVVRGLGDVATPRSPRDVPKARTGELAGLGKAPGRRSMVVPPRAVTDADHPS